MAAISWKSSVSGSWNTAADWSTGTVPAAGDDVTIGVGGSYTVSITALPVAIDSLTINDPTAVLAIDTSGAGGSNVALTGALTNSGTIEIGNANLTAATTVSVDGLSNTGTIDLTGSATVQASLLVEPGAPTTLTAKYFLSGDAELGFESGAITAIGSGAELSLTGAKARVALGSAPRSNSALTQLGSNAGTLNLENGAAITTAGGFANTDVVDIDTNSGVGGSRLTVGGLLASGDNITIGNASLDANTIVTAADLANVGQINLTGSGANEAALIVNAAVPSLFEGIYSLTNDALLEFASGGITEIFDGWSLLLNGAQARVALASAPNSNSALAGLANNNGTLRLDGGASVTTSGDLTNSVTLEVDDISGSGGSRLTIGGTLTNHGTLTIGNTTLSAPTKVTAAGLVNTSAINLTGSGFVQATLDITAAAPSIFTGDNKLVGDALLEYASGAINEIAIGEETSLNGPKARVALASAFNSNSALTSLSTNDGTFNLENGAVVATTVGLTNANGAVIDVDSVSGTGGSRLTIGGTLTNFGNVNIGNSTLSAATLVKVSELADSADIDLTGGVSVQATLEVTAPPPATILGGTLIELANDALLEYGPIVGINGGAELYLDGARSRVALASALGGNSALTTFQQNNGTLRLDGGTIVSIVTNVSNSGTVEIDDTGGGSRLTIGETLTNDGRLTIGNSSLNAATVVAAAGLSNTGTISLTGGISVQATLDIAGAAPSNLTGVNDLTNDALLEYGSGAITGINSGATLYLDGARSRVALAAATGNNSALTTLDSNAGTLRLDGGAVVTTAASTNLANSGLLEVDDAGGGSRLTIGGALSNNATITIGNVNLNAPATVEAAGFSNTGTLNLTGSVSVQATVDDTGAAPGILTGVNNLTNDALLEYGSGAITGINSGATLYLDGAKARAALASSTGSNSALTTLAVNSGTLRLDAGAIVSTTTTLSNAGTVEVDDVSGSGGGSLTIGGTLTNGGTITIGNSILSAPTTVTAAELANSGKINLTGARSVQATLDITGVAPATLNGSISLTNDALLEFKSGAITAIATAAALNLTGAAARVALASATGSNSALTQLTSNAGTLALDGGARLATTGVLSNSGTLDVDNTGAGGSSVTIGGTLGNTGTVDIGNSSSLSQATTVTAAGLDLSSGALNIVGHAATATLTLTGAASDSGSITIGNAGVLALGGNSMSVVNPGTLAVNGGEISGGTLTGAGTIDSGASSSSTLNGVTIASGTTFAAGANSFLTVDHVTVDGTLTGGGTAGLVFGVHGADTMTNIAGFPTIALADGGANTLTLKSTNFAGIGSGTITVYDGDNGNTVTNSGLSAGEGIVVYAGGGADKLTGGAGNDVFYAGGDTTMTGKGGTNEFAFLGSGASNVIADFAASSSNELVFSNFGFSLGLGGASTTPQALPMNLFVSNGTGTFTNTTERFGYNSGNGQLLFSSDGSGSTPQLVATLTNHPGLTASQLFFVT